jgi:hypothetical protein
LKRLFLVVTALTISALCFGASSAAEVAGTYVLKLGEESAALCRLLQLPMPQSKITLDESSRFTFERNVNGKILQNQGAFAVERGVLILFGKKLGKSPIRAKVQPGVLVIDGLLYERMPVCELVGTWVVVQANGFVDAATKFTFTEKGTFRYKGLGGTSAGKYDVDEGVIHLTYTEVDGSRVEEPFHGKAYRNDAGFRIDRYRFIRA